MGPLATFLRTHGLLDLAGRPQWQTIRGGAARYLEALVAPIRSLVREGTRVRGIRRRADGVEIEPATGPVESFDRVVVAVHGDQVLPLVTDATPAERAAFASFRYVENDVVLHTDDRLLPRRPRARASWNAVVPASSTEPIRVTYDMTRLQGLDAPQAICVTLNARDGRDAIDPARIVRRFRYRHPLLAPDAAAAAERVAALDGADRIHYCGAYLGYGFHEDGVRSAVETVARIDAS
jgi:predicted NAD/FAD-binding protein